MNPRLRVVTMVTTGGERKYLQHQLGTQSWPKKKADPVLQAHCCTLAWEVGWGGAQQKGDEPFCPWPAAILTKQFSVPGRKFLGNLQGSSSKTCCESHWPLSTAGDRAQTLKSLMHPFQQEDKNAAYSRTKRHIRVLVIAGVRNCGICSRAWGAAPATGKPLVSLC